MFKSRLHEFSVKNFLKTAPHQHKDPQVRIGFIQELDAGNEAAQHTLSDMAQNDQDLQVRLSAIGKIDELTTLRGLLDANGDNAQNIVDAAEARLVGKLKRGEISDIAARALLASHGARLAVPIAASSAQAEQREMALGAINDDASLLAVVQQSPFHEMRLVAAMRLSQHDALRSALSAMRSKDKVVAKSLQQKLDAAAAAEAALIASKHDVNKCLQSLQGLVDGVWTPQHAGRLQALKEKWANLDSQSTHEHQAEFETAVTQAQQHLQEYIARQSQEELSERPMVADNGVDSAPPSDSAQAQADPDVSITSVEQPEIAQVTDPALDSVLPQLAPCDIAGLSATIETMQRQIDDGQLQTSENVVNVLAYTQSIAVLFDPPYEINKARPGALQQRMKRVSALTDVPAVLPGINLSGHVYVAELEAHHSQLSDRLEKAKQESADRIKATHRQFAALAGIIKEGKWGPANSMLLRLTKKIDSMEQAERSTLNDKLERAEQQLNEMADWQDFASRPKLEALCEQMEALPAAQLDPDNLAKQVRELQSAWKGLGVSRASNELWTRFKSAGDTAYEPCKAWFAVKQQERQVKLDAKAHLCEKLESEKAQLDDTPDWKAIVRLINGAKREWSANRVPDRKPDKALEARFSAALEPFESALKEQYEANAIAKQALVDKVAALAEADITQHSANQAKKLLSAWKLVGIMRRKEDQALWEVFNSHLGTIFKHQHKVERDKQRAELEHVYRAKDIIKQLKSMARGDAINEAEIQSLTTEFHSLPDFPERDKKFLLRDFRQAIDACSRVNENAAKRKARAEIDERDRLVQLCSQLEHAIEHRDAASETLIEDISHAWEDTQVHLPSEIATHLQKRRDEAIQHISSGTCPDFDENEKQRRELLIRMEVAAGVETPAEDKARRMAYQLQHLQEGMASAGLEDTSQTLSKLEEQWLAAGPVSSSILDALHSRYLKAMKR
ncbi:MAG: DUF349 domain-containing protein [Granulosicoccus sp.]